MSVVERKDRVQVAVGVCVWSTVLKVPEERMQEEIAEPIKTKCEL